MRVLIAVASSSGQLSGVQRHAINLARCLLTRAEITEVHLAFAPWQLGFMRDSFESGDVRLYLHSVPIGNGAISRNFWFYAQLPKLVARLKADILHLAYPVAVRKHSLHCPVVVTLHDLYPYDIPENCGFPKVLFNRAVLQHCLRSADAIACVSQSTLTRFEGMEPQLALQRAALIHNSVEPQAAVLWESPHPEWGRRPFLLCVAQHRRNKNILLALRVFGRLLRSGSLAAHTRMIIVGIPGPETAAIYRFLAESGLMHQVELLNGISEQRLQWCYRNCEVLLAPSIHEGFGMPIAEALLEGCRVVCSDIAAFREFGEHCRFVALGPNEEQAFADAVRDSMDYPSPAPIALPHLSAPVIAERYLRLYRTVQCAFNPNQESAGTLFSNAKERQRIR